MRYSRALVVLFSSVSIFFPASSLAQTAASAKPDVLLKNVLEDQKEIWTGPAKIRLRDAEWLVPFAGITTGLIMSDRTASTEATRNSHVTTSQHLSDYGIAAMGGTAVGLYGLGRLHGDDQLSETGILSGEAMVDSLPVDEALKYTFGRYRPFEANNSARFFKSGTSFPSGHSGLAWAFASVVAHEYPGWLTQTLAYGAASAISIARVTGKQHYPSDVFVSGAVGYLVGRQVYRSHHELTRDDLGNYGQFVSERTNTPGNIGSVYVPLDSWVYPAVERLAAARVVRTEFLGLRPWTRVALAMMLLQAEEPPDDSDTWTKLTFERLRAEFNPEIGLADGKSVDSIGVDSVYTRGTYIAGHPLNDSFHFGQTLINDFGRPYQQGFNEVTGFSTHAESGRFAFYVRGEYQHAPGASAYPASVRNLISQLDFIPVPPGNAIQPVNSFRLLDTYVSATVIGNQISVGKQSLWWGPTEAGAMILSDNAEPFYMLRINRVIPLKLPSIFGLLGPVRYDNFFGRLAGHKFPRQPFFYGQKINFKPTENLELGFSRTATFAGQGATPLTFGTFWNSFTSTSDVPPQVKATNKDPGARHGSFDLTYRVPYLRKWLTVYTDSLVHDEPSPLSAPRKAAINPGIYLEKFPRIPNLDLRVEAVRSDVPTLPSQAGHFFYYEGIYREAYLNKGFLMGNWIGREAKGGQAWLTYWLSPISTVQISYRRAKTSKDFIPGGGTQNDYSAEARLRVTKDLELRAFEQYEKWNVPVLGGKTSDFTSAIELQFFPQHLQKVR